MFSLTASQISKRSQLARHLRLNVAVEDSISVHVLDCLQQLVDVGLDSRLRQVVWPAFDGFIQIHFHYLKDEGQSTCRFIVKHLNQLNNVIVR